MVIHQLQVERRTGKVRPPETVVLPLSHATNSNCIIEQFFKNFDVSNGDTVKDVQNFVSLDDVAKIVEKRLV